MSEPIVQGPPEEQGICVICGLCCDGTIFRHGHLKPGEKESVPEKMTEEIYVENNEEYFLLPCYYFRGRCTIYSQRRAEVCGTYRCQLLKEFTGEKITRAGGAEVIRNALELRDSIIDEYRRISGKKEEISFRQLITDLGRLIRTATEESPAGVQYDMLLARCNIFEMLLIKHFRSAEEFEEMKMK